MMTEQQTHSEQSNQKASRRWRRWLIGISAVLFSIVLLLLIMLSNAAGQRALVRLVDTIWQDLHIEDVSGSLQEGLVLNNLQFKTDAVQVELLTARLQLQPNCLWQRQICLDELKLQSAKIHLKTTALSPSEPSNQPMQKINLPFSLQGKQLAINDLDLYIDQHHITLGSLQSAVSLNNEMGLSLAPTLIENLHITTQQDDTPSATVETDWQALTQQLMPPLLADLEKIELPFDLHLTDIQGKNWQYQHLVKNDLPFQIEIPFVQLKAQTQGSDVQLQQFQLQSSLGHLQAQGNMQLEQDFPVDLQLRANVTDIVQHQQLIFPHSTLSLQVSGNLKKQTALSLQLQGGIEANVTGEVALNREKTPFQLQLTSPLLQYPFDPKAKDPFKLTNVSAKAEGDLLDYQLALNTDLAGGGMPKTAVQLAAKGGLTALEIENLQLNGRKGQGNIQGQLSWQKGFAWQSNMKLDQFDLSDYVPTFPAELSGQVDINGQIEGDHWQIEAPTIDLQGQLSRRPLSLKGSLLMNPQQWFNSPELVFNYGDNRIVAMGQLSNNSDFTLDVKAPDLRGLLPNFSASLEGAVKLVGRVTEPYLDVDFTGENVKFEAFNLNRFDLIGQLTSDQQFQGQLALDVAGLGYGDFKLNKGQLTLAGTERKHQLKVTSQGNPVALNLDLSGNFDRTSLQWNGVLNHINMPSEFGQWKANQAVKLHYDYAQTQATIEGHCWLHSDLELCFPQGIQAGKQGEMPFQLKKLNLTLVNKLIKQEMLKGQLRSEGKLAWFENQPMQLAVQVEGDQLAFTQKVDARTFQLNIPRLKTSGQLQNNQLQFESDVSLAEQGKLRLALTIQDILKQRQLGGSLNLTQLNLSLVNQLLSKNEKLNGDLSANLTFSGTLEQPLLNGVIEGRHLSAKMRTLPFDVKDGKLSLGFHGNHSTFTGQLQTAESTLKLEGDASWKHLADWQSRLHVQADKFKVDIPAIAKLKISPNIEIRATPNLLKLSGNVDIPWARVEIESLPDSAVSVSADEVILDQKGKRNLLKTTVPTQTKQGMLIQSDLKINIGDDVSLNAYGLKTGLKGTLAVQQDKRQLGLFGQVYLVNGRYTSFGQDLVVRRGMINFSGPVEQPMLNIEAIRNPNSIEDRSVVAGIKVFGIPTNPEVVVFSEPSMPQDQALAYILTGRSLENSGEAGSGSSIGAALLGMGLAKSGKLVGGIGEAFGIQDLNLGTQGVGDSSKVVVSGNITPRLQVKYGVGLFDGLAEFTVRYRLIPKLYLQSVSGVTQAVDLLYQFEF